jgi:hypothetical protein
MMRSRSAVSAPRHVRGEPATIVDRKKFRSACLTLSFEQRRLKRRPLLHTYLNYVSVWRQVKLIAKDFLAI